jgi:hypothetical protein
MEAMRRARRQRRVGRARRAFAASEFPLYHANLAARDNLRAGLSPPWSGHYLHNGHADDIDWQIEADFVGLMTPGPARPPPRTSRSGRAHHEPRGRRARRGLRRDHDLHRVRRRVGRGDRPRRAVEAVLEGSAYRARARPGLGRLGRRRALRAGPRSTLRAMGRTTTGAPSGAGDADPLNIDAKLNGAFILLGLLYGEGDLATFDALRDGRRAGQRLQPSRTSAASSARSTGPASSVRLTPTGSRRSTRHASSTPPSTRSMTWSA